MSVSKEHSQTKMQSIPFFLIFNQSSESYLNLFDRLDRQASLKIV